MKPFVAMVIGALLLLAPLRWLLAVLVPVPEYRTGTFSDFAPAIIAGVTLYAGVFVGVLIGKRLAAQRGEVVSSGTVFVAGMAGAIVAMTLAVSGWALSQWVSTGRIFQPGTSLALFPVLFILGGVLSAFIAGGAGLFAYAFGAWKR